MEKKLLRRQKIYERDSLSVKARQAFSSIISQKIVGLEQFIKSEKILCYVSFKSEVDTMSILKTALSFGKKVAVPRVEGDSMLFYKIDGLSDFKPGYYGIMEPKNNDIVDPDNSFMIVPGVVFDHNLNRVGYGKGFYDRYFIANKDKKIFKCGICFDIQLCEKIETDEFDQSLDMIITESNNYYA